MLQVPCLGGEAGGESRWPLPCSSGPDVIVKCHEQVDGGIVVSGAFRKGFGLAGESPQKVAEVAVDPFHGSGRSDRGVVGALPDTFFDLRDLSSRAVFYDLDVGEGVPEDFWHGG